MSNTFTITPQKRANLRRVAATAELCCLKSITVPHSDVTDLLSSIEQAEAENARLTAQLAALSGEQEDCKLHPCPYSREGLNCGVISLANNRVYEGVVDNARLTKMMTWLANELGERDSSRSPHDWKEAARRAVDDESEVKG